MDGRSSSTRASTDAGYPQEDLHLPGSAGQGAASDDPQLDQDQVRQVRVTSTLPVRSSAGRVAGPDRLDGAYGCATGKITNED